MAGWMRFAAAPKAVTGWPATGSGPPTGMYDHSSSITRATCRARARTWTNSKGALLQQALSRQTPCDTLQKALSLGRPSPSGVATGFGNASLQHTL